MTRYQPSKTADVGPELVDNRRRRIQTRSIEDFWKRMQKPIGCWLYDGAREINGYGYVRNPLGDSPKYITAHRLAWILKNGPIADGLKVLHTCDVRGCCNPEHLFLGTDADNRKDMVAKGRYTFGEKSRSATLTEAQAREIVRDYRLFSPRRSNADELAKRYGVDRHTVYLVGSRRTWRWL